MNPRAHNNRLNRFRVKLVQSSEPLTAWVKDEHIENLSSIKHGKLFEKGHRVQSMESTE